MSEIETLRANFGVEVARLKAQLVDERAYWETVRDEAVAVSNRNYAEVERLRACALTVPHAYVYADDPDDETGRCQLCDVERSSHKAGRE